MDLWSVEKTVKDGVRYNRNVFAGAPKGNQPKVRGGMRLWVVGSMDNFINRHIQDPYNDNAENTKYNSKNKEFRGMLQAPGRENHEKSLTGSDPQSGKSFRRAWLKFSDRTSLQGVTLVQHASRWYRKLFWITVFLAALGGCVFQVMNLTKKYLRYETQVIVKLGFGEQPFPSVTLCNLNVIRKSQLNQTTEELQSFLNIVDNKNFTTSLIDPDFSGPFNNKFSGKRSNSDEKHQEYLFLAAKMDQTIRKQVGHQIENMLMWCSFDGRHCSHRNFSHFFSREHGNCFTFNSLEYNPSGIKAYRWGERWGLMMMLNTQHHEYLVNRTTESGFMVRIHPFGTMPTMGDRSFAISPGEVNRASIRSMMVIRKGLPYSSCGDQVHFEEELGFRYTREACLQTCADRLIAETCQCYREDFIENYPESDSTDLRKCVKSADPNSSDCSCIEKVIGSHDCMKCDCSPPCIETEYKVEHSSSLWPDENFWNSLMEMTCNRVNDTGCETLRRTPSGNRLSVLRENYVLLNIFFASMNTKNLTEIAAYEPTQFVSDIGGTLGLYIGASFLTFAELVDLMRELLAVVVTRLCRRRGVTRREGRAVT